MSTIPSHTPEPKPGYRRGVGVMLVNGQGLVLVARRIDMPSEAWQMPQGGIDPGEAPAAAALRELREEIGTDKAEILAESRGWLNYDLPEELIAVLWGGRYR
ncbi:MAG TPA: RNA pyrophosphohydrolase, partial [Alphaproteobacteria bacterium]|nr:RNA pyrophosphohydrolase [Alphaproteobacteria bacterium]